MLCCLHLAAVAEMVVTLGITAVIAVQNKALRNVFGSKWRK
jgi:Tfp pilus assembly protein PilV